MKKKDGDKREEITKRGPMQFRDVMEIVSGFSEENTKINDHTDSETGEKIPDGMPLWRWRRRRRTS